MKYELKTPCDGCPFRNKGDKRVHNLGYNRAEIADSLQMGGTFSCHKTNDSYDGEAVETMDSQFCAGALILMEKDLEEQGGCMVGQLTRISARLGCFNPDELDMEADVFDTFQDFQDGHDQ